MRRYFVKTSIANLQAINHYNIRNLKINDDTIEFTTDAKSFERIKNDIEIEYQDLTRNALHIILKKYSITIIGIILIILALINQSMSVIEVRFTDPDTYNQEIIDYLQKYYHKVGPFHYLNTNLTDINFDLRSEFYHYEWIGIRRKGSIIFVDIKQIVNPPIIEDKTPGSYYAKYDAIVKRYHIEKGIVVVQEEMYVPKGSLLISGKITHYGNKVESIRAKGYVIGEVLLYKDYTIPKKTTNIVRTGKMEIVKEYFLFGLKLGKTATDFQDYDDEFGKTLKLSFIFSSKTVYRYEVKKQTITYNQNEAIEYAKSMVVKEFRNQKINIFEKIIFNNLVKIEEDDNYYHVRLIVKRYQNIAEFIPD